MSLSSPARWCQPRCGAAGWHSRVGAGRAGGDRPAPDAALSLGSTSWWPRGRSRWPRAASRSSGRRSAPTPRARPGTAAACSKWGALGGGSPRNVGFAPLGDTKGLCGVFCLPARARAGSDLADRMSVTAAAVSLHYHPVCCSVPSKNQCLARSGEGLRQQERLWRVPVSECMSSSSTEGLESDGKVKGRAPAGRSFMGSVWEAAGST